MADAYPEHAVICYGRARAMGAHAERSYAWIRALARKRMMGKIESESNTAGATFTLHEEWEPAPRYPREVTAAAVVSFTREDGTPYKPEVQPAQWLDPEEEQAESEEG